MAGVSYERAGPPRLWRFYEWSCARCGHEELGHPVFLKGPDGRVIAVGSGCAEKLTGRAAKEWDADLAAQELAKDAELAAAVSHLGTFLPARVTEKMIGELERDVRPDGRPIGRQKAERAAELYRALYRAGKGGAVRQWRGRL